MVAGEDALWIVEANHHQVLTVTPDGTITRIADRSVLGNQAPTGIALAPEGGVYVGFLSPLPFADGSARVVQTGPGNAEDVATGLTFPVKMEVGPDGALYVGYPAFGATNGEGSILQFDLASGEAIASMIPWLCSA